MTKRRANQSSVPLFFGTYNESSHPRVLVLKQGLVDNGYLIDEINHPLAASTSDRVKATKSLAQLARLIRQIFSSWRNLVKQSRSVEKPNVVVVGYMGHFDVHLARLLFPGAHIVLDYLISFKNTATDRGIRGLPKVVMGVVDWAALKQADTVLCDTEEQLGLVSSKWLDKALVVHVGAPLAWHIPARPTSDREGPLKVVFYGLFTPLQGTKTIAEGLKHALDRGAHLEVTMIGHGQDHPQMLEILGGNESVNFIDWVDSSDLPAIVSSNDVSLGIFGETPKTSRVVPNKVYQGIAAQTLTVTAATECQQRVVGDFCEFVPAGDAKQLGEKLIDLANNRPSRQALTKTQSEQWLPKNVVEPFISHLELNELIHQQPRPHENSI